MQQSTGGDTRTPQKGLTHTHFTHSLYPFDLSPRVLNGVKTGAVAFAIDQQQFLQGYLPIVHLSLYHRYQLVPPKSLPSGPGLVTPETALQVVTLSGQGIR